MLIALFVLVWPQLASAETTIQATVDKTNVTTDDSITYTVSIASSEKVIPNPTLPAFERFSIIAQQQSSNISFGKSGIVSSITLTLSLVPVGAGTFAIEPAQIKVKDKIYKSDSFTIEVKPGVAPRHPSQEQAEESEEPQITL
jgi:hypothetical protein